MLSGHGIPNTLARPTNQNQQKDNMKRLPVPAFARFTLATVAALDLVACHHGHNPDPTGPAQTYTLSGTVSGLTSGGLALNVNGSTVQVANSATTVSLAAGLSSGTTYTVAVATQPTGQTCSVANGKGTIGSANVANVVVTCSNQAYSLGGTVSGLNGSGLVLVNGQDTVTVSSGADNFTFPTAVAFGSSYSVTVQTQPGGLACSVSNGTGTMPAAAVISVAVSCSDQPFTVGGTIAGLGANTGLVLSNGTDQLTVAANATTFLMPTGVSFGSNYAVAVQSSPPGLTCSVSNGSGTMGTLNITNVSVTCSDQSFGLGGTVSGLSANGLVLANNGGDTLPVSAGATSFILHTDVPYTSTYSVTVQTQPTNETCTVSNATGTMPAHAINNVAVSCSVNTYTVGGSISGLGAHTGLMLLNNGTDATTIAANATTFTMNTGLANGAAYAIMVKSSPDGIRCAVTSGTGTISGTDVTNINVSCSALTESVAHSFDASEGAHAYGSLIEASDGNFYGLTFDGGANNEGTLFRYNPATQSATVLHSFAGGTDGAYAYGSLIQAADGSLYGLTYGGGTHNAGTLFKYDLTTNIETVLHSFAGGSSDGSNPYGSLLQASDGKLYGLTLSGGSSGGYGTLFEYDPTSNIYIVRHSFGGQSGSDGAYPYYGSLIQAIDGNLYGLTANGGVGNDIGTIFEFNTTTHAVAVLYSFMGGSDGANPMGSLIQASDGNFYGLTHGGGAQNLGTLFEYNPTTHTETVLHSFAGTTSDGSSPYGALIQASDGNFYGLTSSGGAHATSGTAFEYNPTTQTETVLSSFGGASGDGTSPRGSLLQASDGNFYGLTQSGGAIGRGTVFVLH